MVARLVVLAAVAAGAFAQNLSLGVMAGTNLTRGIGSTTTTLGGATLQWSLPYNLSLEFDGVWHSYTAGPQLGTDITWEFPLLARYRFSLRFAKPFVEAGPCFRIGAPTDTGFAAGAGLEIHVFHNLSFAPTLRYIHWASSAASLLNRWNPNQVEFLTAFRTTAEENTRPLGPNVWLGVVLGSTLTDEFHSISQTGLIVAGNSAPFTATSVLIGQSSFEIGPSLEIQLPLELAVEIEAIRRPIPELHYWTVSSGTVLTPAEAAALNALNAASQGSPDIIWEFPVLAKYKFQLSRAEPLVELGPSFRLPQELNGGHISTYGITGGAGFELHLLRVRIAPEMRFTRWAADTSAGSTQFNRSQLELLTVFAF